MNETKQKEKTILVIEDDKSLQEVIADKLQISGFRVVLARTKQEGIDALIDEEQVDLIWLDHYLFGQEDGIDFLNEVRKSLDWKKIPIFVISNTAGTDKVNAYLALGANKYYTKAEHKLNHIINDIKQFLSE